MHDAMTDVDWGSLMQPYDDLLRQAGSDPAHVRQLYDAWAEQYDKDLAAWGYQAPMVAGAKLWTQMADPAAMAVLDAGCGTGLTGQALRAAGFETIDGVDLSADSLAIAARSGIYRHLAPVDFTVLPSSLADGVYGAVLCVGVMSYLPDTESVCREFCRLTAPGGAIVLTQRSDIFRQRGDMAAFVQLEAEGLWRIREVSGPLPYLPGNPEFNGVGVLYCCFQRT